MAMERFNLHPNQFIKFIHYMQISKMIELSYNLYHLIYVLLPNKAYNTYERMFRILRDNFSLNMDSNKCDDEIVVNNLVKNVFDDFSVIGWYFFLNDLRRKSLQLNQNSTLEGKKYWAYFINYHTPCYVYS